MRQEQNLPKIYEPFRDILGWDDDQFFGLPILPFRDKSLARNFAFNPALDVSEEADRFVVKADLPGMDKKDVQVNVQNDILTIKGERKAESEQKGKNYHRVERSYGSFQRSIRLGQAVKSKDIKANYKNGVLEIVLPKSEDSQTKQIDIDVT